MKRHLLTSLQEWLHRKSRKPLLLHGARQVGKTWLIRELARIENIPLTEINFELHPAERVSNPQKNSTRSAKTPERKIENFLASPISRAKRPPDR